MVLKSLIVRDIFQLCYYTVSPPKKIPNIFNYNFKNTAGLWPNWAA